MRDLDRMIDEAIGEEERELLRRIGEEPGFIAQAATAYASSRPKYHSAPEKNVDISFINAGAPNLRCSTPELAGNFASRRGGRS